MKTVLLDLFTSKKFLAAVSAVAIYVAGRFGFQLDPAVLDRIFAALLVYVGAQGVADAGKSAALIRSAAPGLHQLAPRVSPDISQIQKSTIGGPVAALCLGLGVGAFALQSGCATARDRATVGAAALIDCEADHLRAGVAELVPLATQAVLAAISGDGRHVDTAPIRAAAQALRSDLGRCALATAIAILATPTRPTSSGLAAAALKVDSGELLAAFESVRGELGGSAYKTSAGVL